MSSTVPDAVKQITFGLKVEKQTGLISILFTISGHEIPHLEEFCVFIVNVTYCCIVSSLRLRHRS